MRQFLLLFALVSAASPAAAADWWLLFEERSAARPSIVLADASSIERQGDLVHVAFALVAGGETPEGLAGGVLRVELLCAGKQMRLVRAEPLPGIRLPRVAQARDGAFRPFSGHEADPVIRFACAGERTGFTHLPAVTDVAAEAERRFAEIGRRLPPPAPVPAAIGPQERERRNRMRGGAHIATFRQALVEGCGTAPACQNYADEGGRGVPAAAEIEEATCADRPREGARTAGRSVSLSCRFSLRLARTGRTASCTIDVAEEWGPTSRGWSYRRVRPEPPGALPPPPGTIEARVDETTLRCSADLLRLVSR